MAQTSTGTNQGINGNTNFLSNLIRRFKPDAMDVLGQRIGIGLNLFNRGFPVGLENTHGPARTYTIAVEKDHDLPDDLLLRPSILDLLPALGTDALDVFQLG